VGSRLQLEGSEARANLIDILRQAPKGSTALDRCVPYEIGFGDPMSRRNFERFGPTMEGSPSDWLPPPPHDR